MAQKKVWKPVKNLRSPSGFHENDFEGVRRTPRNICLPSFLLQEAGLNESQLKQKYSFSLPYGVLKHLVKAAQKSGGKKELLFTSVRSLFRIWANVCLKKTVKLLDLERIYNTSRSNFVFKVSKIRQTGVFKNYVNLMSISFVGAFFAKITPEIHELI